MRFGLVTPVVTCHPDHHSEWEEQGGPAEIARIAAAADGLGYHHLTCSEHVAIPTGVAAIRGSRYYDPLATLAFIAAQTTSIRLVTHVLVLPYHHPLALAKRYGTLDRLSGGRLVLGVGVGSLEEEFAALGVDFAGRGSRYEDGLRALRAAFGRREPSYAGSHYRFDGMIVDPCGVQEHVPIWLGGRSERSLRRALLFADGWDPFRLTLAELEELLPRARAWPAWRARTASFDVVLTPERPPDPTVAGARGALTALLERQRAAGATVVNLRFQNRSLAHFLEQLAAFSAEVAPHFAGDT
jgi:probable F420-dependent oxidoreductase